MTSAPKGLTASEAAARLARHGPNAVRAHRARPLRVLWRQLRSPIVLLLFVTSFVAAFVGDSTDAVVIGVILLVSIVLGFVNEFRAERAADALHDRLRHTVLVIRDGQRVRVDVTDLVPGDVVTLTVGTVISGDMRLLECEALECDESILTGEAGAVRKSTAAVPTGTDIDDLTCCALMGTVVHAGGGTGIVVAAAARTEFGRIAVGLAAQEPETESHRGLGRFSAFLLVVAIVLTSSIFVIAVALGRPILESLLFSLAIAVGITPQLLPAVVSTSLAAGSREMARHRVLVKRMVCIEDLGDLDTDKTGTLTSGTIVFERPGPTDDTDGAELLRLGLLASEADPASPATVGLNALDAALWRSADVPDTRDFRRLDALPFDHGRRMSSALGSDRGDAVLIVKGAAESVPPRCDAIADGAGAILDELYRGGQRVVAVASRPAPGARDSLLRLAGLGVDVKIATGTAPVRQSASVLNSGCRQVAPSPATTLTASTTRA